MQGGDFNMTKIPKPNYTQVPNVILDNMAEMGNAEFRIICAIARKTFGWQKTIDRISLSQLCAITGLSRQGVIDGTAVAIENGWIEKVECGNSFEYSLIVKEVDQEEGSQASRPIMVKPVDQSLVKPVDTQKKELKKEETIARKRAEEPPTPKPPKPERERTELQKELKHIQELFSTLTGLKEPEPKTKKEFRAAGELWYQPIRRIQQECNGSSLAIVEAAVKRLKHKNVTIASPKSIENTVKAIHGELVVAKNSQPVNQKIYV
jgi:phage replication O-like protein O